MARYENVDGLLLLNKPAGLTSNQALQRVKRLLNAKKAGHTGSLDPAATGMLPLCFGEATKVCAFLLDADKSYRVTAKLGSATDTGDADGKVTDTASVGDLGADDWRVILDGFLGESMQIPPMYSAIRKHGTRLYKLARKGEIFEREPRRIRIDSIELLEVAGSRLVFRVQCSKGTYIRALVEDIARQAGTLAHTSALHRESVAGLRSEDMLDMAQLEQIADKGVDRLREQLLPPDTALGSLQAITLEQSAGDRFLDGQAVAAAGQDVVELVRVYGPERAFLGVGSVATGGKLHPKRVFRQGEKNL